MVSGVVSNGASTAAVQKDGAGTWAFSGANSFTGNIDINDGTLVASRSNNFFNPTSSALGNPRAVRNITVNNGVTLKFSQGDTFGGATTAVLSTLVINSGGIVTNNGLIFTTLGPVSLNGGTLTGPSGAIGGFQMYNLLGTITVGGTVASTISGPAAGGPTFGGYHLAAAGTTFNVADATGTSAVDLTVSGTLINTSNTLAAAGLIKSGVGTMLLSGTNTYTGGTTISAGTLQIGSGSSLGSTSGTLTVNTGTGSTLDLNGNDLGVGNFTGTGGTIVNNATGTNKTLTIGNNNSTGGNYAGAIANNTSGTGTLALTKTGSGTLTLSGTNTYTGGTTISAGTLQIGSGSSLGSTSGTLTVNTGTGSTLDLNGNDLGVGNFTGTGGTIINNATGTNKTLTIGNNNSTGGNYAGSIANNTSGTGTLALTKTGSGTLTLSGTNTYTGPTAINAGTLALDASGSIASTTVSVAAGAVLDTTAKATYTLPTALTLAINATSGTSGKINAAGQALVINGSAVTFNTTGSLTAPAYVLATYGSISGTATFGSIIGSIPTGYAINYAYNSGTQIALVKSGYDSWTSSFGLTGADALPGADPDNDGIKNLLEYVLGGNPTVSSQSILPTQDSSGANLVFTFTRSDASETDTTQIFQYGTDLTGWTNVTIGAVSSGPDGNGVTVAVVENGTSADAITVTVPKGTNVKLFGRLQAVKLP